MRATSFVPIALVLLLAGCATSVQQPTASPTPSAPSATPEPEAEAATLPTPEAANDAVRAPFGDDTRIPSSSFYAGLEPAQPQFFRDERTPTGQTATMRVACAVEGAGGVSIEVTMEGADPFVYEAICAHTASETEGTLTTSQSEPFPLGGPYTVTLTPEDRSVVAVGFIWE